MARNAPLRCALLLLLGCSSQPSSLEATGSVFPQGRPDEGGAAGSPELPGSRLRLERAVFYSDEGGTYMRFLGDDPEGALDTVRLSFLDKSGLPRLVDTDGDHEPDAPFFDVGTGSRLEGGRFLVRVNGVANFDPEAQFVVARPLARSSFLPPELKVPRGARPSRAMGEGCDPLGFDQCPAEAACVGRSEGGAYVCRDTETLRRERVESASEWDMRQLPIQSMGRAEGVSLWDPPEGCLASVSRGMPEAVWRLHVHAPARRIVVETLAPPTAFDPIVSIYPAAGMSGGGPQALRCNDDGAEGVQARLVWDDVPAGDYVVVVDAVGEEGGALAVRVSSE